MDRFSMTLNLSQQPFKSLRNQTVIRLSYTDRQTGTGESDGHNTFPMDLTNMRSSLFYMTDDQLDYLQGQLEVYTTKTGSSMYPSPITPIGIFGKALH